MRISNVAQGMVCLLMGIGSLVPGMAQKAADPSMDAVEFRPVLSRVVDHVDDSRLVTLVGNTHPMAQPKYEKGLVESGKLLERIVLVLERSPEQEKELAAFNERQYDPQSADYHRWLHAEEFGRLFGPSDSDVTAVTSWLETHGFSIYEVSKGRTTIQFLGHRAASAGHFSRGDAQVRGQWRAAHCE